MPTHGCDGAVHLVFMGASVVAILLLPCVWFTSWHDSVLLCTHAHDGTSRRGSIATAVQASSSLNVSLCPRVTSWQGYCTVQYSVIQWNNLMVQVAPCNTLRFGFAQADEILLEILDEFDTRKMGFSWRFYISMAISAIDWRPKGIMHSRSFHWQWNACQ